MSCLVLTYTLHDRGKERKIGHDTTHFFYHYTITFLLLDVFILTRNLFEGPSYDIIGLLSYIEGQ